MSRKMVRVGVCLFVLSLASAAIRSYGGEPRPKLAVGGDDPFGAESPALVVGEKPKPNAKPTEDLDDPFGGGDGSNRSAAKKPTAKEPAPKPAQATKPVPAANAKPKPTSPPKLHGGEKAILKALKQQTSIDFQETPLKDVVEYLSDTHHIPIVLDAAGLKDAGVDPESPVTKHLSGISLQSALEIILDELQLKWVIHHEVLLITSPQKAESDEFMETKVYDVADLVMPVQDQSILGTPLSTTDAMHLDLMVRGVVVQPQPMFGGLGGNRPVGVSPIPVVGMGSTLVPGVAANIGVPPRSYTSYNVQSYQANGADFKPLMDLIQNTVATKSWIDNGGNGTISEMASGAGLFLVISQTREVHQEIEQLLRDLRNRQTCPDFHVELHWLWLDSAHSDALFGKKSTGHSVRVIDEQRLSQVARDVPGFHGRTNCLNGEIGTLAAGDRRALIVNAIPVVDGGIAYQPVVSMPNVGVTANVMPILLPGSKSARLTVRSSITRWTPQRGPATLGAAWAPRSHVNADASQSPVNPPTIQPPLQPAMGRMGMGMGGMGMGGGFMQVAVENPSGSPAGGLAAPAPAAPSNAGTGFPPGAFSPSTPPASQAAAPPTAGTPQGLPQPTAAPTNNGSASTSHSSISSHGAGSTSCPIDLPVMPMQEFGTTLVVPLGKPVVVGSVTFAPAGDAGVGEAKVDPVEVYLIATTSVVKSAVKKAK